MVLGAFCVLLAACAKPQQPTTPVAFTPTPAPSLTPSSTLPPTFAPVPPSPTPSITPAPTPGFSSPLEGISLAELPDIVSNPFDPPAPGQDAGHHGVDFAFYRYKEFTVMEGLPVRAVLSGRVAAALVNTWPYGNALIVESTSAQIPASWEPVIRDVPAPLQITPDPRLYCPPATSTDTSTSNNSLYLLYAHLKEPPQLKIGDPVELGQPIGLVGNTGYSGNAHLHLEVRFGPSGAQFDQMSHYINTAGTEEMVNYCLWRVSGVFQPIDPVTLLTCQP